MGRIFACPDVHGRCDLLRRLLAALKGQHCLDLTQDKLIFLGDLIDRGDDAKGCIDIVRDLEKKHPSNVVVLKGNHEGMCISALRKGRWEDIQCWLYPSNGGPNTLASFQKEAFDRNIATVNSIPEDYLDWMEGLKLFHEEPGFFFSHAPVPKEKDRPKSCQEAPFTEHELVWTYFDDERGKSRHIKDKDGNDVIGVCGHIHRLSQNLFTPRYYKHYLFLDAGCGCYFKAPLVCTEVTTRTPIEIWPEGVTPIVPKKRSYIPHQSF